MFAVNAFCGKGYYGFQNPSFRGCDYFDIVFIDIFQNILAAHRGADGNSLGHCRFGGNYGRLFVAGKHRFYEGVAIFALNGIDMRHLLNDFTFQQLFQGLYNDDEQSAIGPNGTKMFAGIRCSCS